MHTDSDPISASRLEDYLDQTEQSIEQQEEAELDPELIAGGLRQLLHSQRYRADTLASVRRLFRLWLRAGDAAAALAVLDTDGAEVLAALPLDERAPARLSMAFWRVEALFGTGGDPALLAALDAVHSQLAALPVEQQYDNAWEHLGNLATAAGAHALARRCAQARHTLLRAQQQRQAYVAWDETLLAIRQAHSYALEGQHGPAREAALRAIDTLARAGADQDVDHDDWLRTGHALFAIVPDAVGEIVRQVRARIPAGTAFFALRDFDIRIARLEALALHRQGALEQALARARLGRTMVLTDNDDHFSTCVLDWLMEAGQHDEAARLAFESVFHERPVAAAHAWPVAQRALAEGCAGQPYWQLTMAFAGMTDDTAAARGGEALVPYVQRHLALARQYPDPAGGPHPASDAVEAMFLIRTAQDHARALPLLEAAVRDPALPHSGVLFNLWLARIKVHGAAGLDLPYVSASSASSCYNLGVMLGTQLAEALPDGVQVDKAAVRALAARYYEDGLARFEAFVMSGQGSSRDGHAHVYSMLCNNLAIYYDDTRTDVADSLALHHKGIAASPFSEHYQGIMDCHRRAGDDGAMIDAAERLWHYSADHGYSRHDPTDYIDDVAAALYRQDRHTDIAIWLQRLDEWWDSADEEDRAGSEKSYIRALVSVLYYMAYSQRDDALLRLEPVLARVPPLACPYTSRMAAHALRTTGQYERALATYAEALRFVVPGNAWSESQRQSILDGQAECRRLQRGAKPWWKLF